MSVSMRILTFVSDCDDDVQLLNPGWASYHLSEVQ